MENMNPICYQCNKEIIRDPESISTGYGIDKDGHKICFECCGVNDRKTLLETGRLDGYYTRDKLGYYYFSNWPSTLKIKVLGHKESNHNFAGRNGRTDFWFTLEGKTFHGVHIGHNNECARVKMIKS